MSDTVQKRVIGKHACERCRKLKIRCLIDTLEKYGKCRKCYTMGIDCEWKEISTKRRRKRTDARVSDLERQIQSLENTLSGLRSGFIDTSASNSHENASGLTIPFSTSVDTTGQLLENIVLSGTTAPIEVPIQSWQKTPLPHNHQDSPTDQPPPLQNESLFTILGLECFSWQRRLMLFETFRNVLLPQYPVVTLRDEDSFENIEETQPLLAAAILIASSSVSEPQTFKTLHANMLQYFCQKILMEGRKSMEILQALLVTTIWFCPPDALEHLSFYQWTHIVGTMALELGLGGKTLWQANHRAVAALVDDTSAVSMQSFRTMFGVYLMCSRIAISFQRQKMISYSPSTSAALQLFAQNATSINDQNLIAWMRLQTIAEDIENMKSNVELKAESGLTERESVKSDLSLFNDRLNEWASQHDLLLRNGAMKIDYCFCKAKLHELALYVDHDIERLSLPSLFDKKPSANVDIGQVSLNATYIRALLSFVADCRSILDAVLEIDIETLRGCPLLTFFRIAYAFRALAMLKTKSYDLKSSISKIIDDESLRWEYYVLAVSEHMEAASDGDLFVVPAMTVRIRDSFRNRQRATTAPFKVDKLGLSQSRYDDLTTTDRGAPNVAPQEPHDGAEIDASDYPSDSASIQDWYDQVFDISMPMVDDVSLFATQRDVNLASDTS